MSSVEQQVGNFIGSVFVDNKNLVVELLKNGYVTIRDERGSEFKGAEDEAKNQRLNVWQNWKEEEPENNNDDENIPLESTNGDAAVTPDKKEDRKPVIITEVANDLSSFYAQFENDGPGLEALLTEMREELTSNPPLPGAFTPKKGEYCAAIFSADGLWYRARVDKVVSKSEYQVTFVDYGNSEVVPFKNIGPFPDSKFSINSYPAAAKIYALAFVALPDSDAEVVQDAREYFMEDAYNRTLLLRVEYKDASSGLEYATVHTKDGSVDIGKTLVEEGVLMVNLKDRRRERRLQKVIAEYRAAQDAAKKNRVRCLFIC